MNKLFAGFFFGLLGGSLISRTHVNRADSTLQKTDLGAGLAGFHGDGVFLHADDLANDTANGGDLIANLQRIAHGGFFLLLLLRGADNQEVEDQSKYNDHTDGKQKTCGHLEYLVGQLVLLSFVRQNL